MPALFDGPDGAQSGGAASQRRPQAVELGAPLDRRHLRVPGRRFADHHGHARRPDRTAPAPLDRRRGVRAGFHPCRLLDQRRDADRSPGAARHRGGDACAVDAFADQQHVPRPGTAKLRHRRLDRQLLGRRSDRPADRRRAPRPFLVGFGLPRRRSGDVAPARGRAVPAAGIPRPQSRPTGPPERRPVARRDPRGDLRDEADRRIRHRMALRFVDPRRPGCRDRFRAATEAACQPADRSQPLPVASVQRVSRDQHPRLLRRLRNLSVHRAVSAAGAWYGAPGGRPVDRAFGPRLRRRFHAGAADRAPGPPGLCDGRRLCACRPGLRPVDPGRRKRRGLRFWLSAMSSWLSVSHRW